MPTSYRGPSIAVVLSIALVAVVTLLLGVFAAVVIDSEKDQRWKQLRNTLELTANQQAAGLAMPMWNLDEVQLLTVMRSGLSNQEVRAVVASTHNKQYVLARDANDHIITMTSEPVETGLLWQEQRIERNGETVGKVRVSVSPRLLERELESGQNSIVLFILALDLTLVLSLYALLWLMMLKPVNALARFAVGVKSGERQAGAPQRPWFSRELNTLTDSISEMLAKLDEGYSQLRESDERLKLATRAANIGIWDWDVVHNELLWNDEMYRQYGIHRDDFQGAYEAWANSLAPEDFLRTNEQVQSALQGKLPFVSEFTIRRPDGSTRVIAGEATVLRDSDGVAIRMVGVNFDITERKRAEEQIKALNSQLEARVTERTAQLESAIDELGQARDAAESATRAKSEFLANMSHEIRTPMNAIMGMNDLALRTELTPRQRGYLAKAKSAAGSLLGIINDILDFSKIEAGKLELEAKEFVLQSVLDKVTVIVGMKAQEKGLELLLDTASDVPRCLVGDSLRLEQVLINLCNNAVKFTASGEIVVVTVKSVMVAGGRMTLRFSVRDTGTGMTEEQISGLFQPFNQLDASITRKHGGTGLGLAICRQLVGLMGGEIGVKSQVGKGSDFHFTAMFGLPSGEQPPEPMQMPSSLRHLRILVIDDSANSREIFRGLLHELGYQPTVASSASSGLAELTRASSVLPYDLVLLDWKMPEMDGFQVVQRIRHTLAPTRRPRIILVTAYGDEDLTRRAVAEKLDGCLTKPVSSAALSDALMTAFGSPHPEPAVHESGVSRDAAAALRGRRVLLVEDNEFNQIVAGELLSDVAGAHVVLACNGEEALEHLRAGPFDAVLMDLQMPVMDGYRTTELIRRDPALRAVPIIAMTAHALVRDREKCLAAGMNDHVTKPFDPDELFSVLVKWIGESKAPPVADPDPDEPAGVSFSLGLQRCLGRTELYDKILRRFLATRLDDPHDIRSALEHHELEQAAGIAHSMISSAGTIGAEGLSDAARSLQLAIDTEDAPRWPELLGSFARHHAAVLVALEMHVALQSIAGSSQD